MELYLTPSAVSHQMKIEPLLTALDRSLAQIARRNGGPGGGAARRRGVELSDAQERSAPGSPSR